MADKMLRGKAPLTVWRGAGGPGGLLYRNNLLDPRAVDPDDRKRLLGEGYLEEVVRDGEGWKLAEPGEGDNPDLRVTVGDTAVVPANETDPGTVNSQPITDGADPEVEQKRAAARARLAELGGTPDGRASDAVLVEYLVGKGQDRNTVENLGRDELKKLVAEAK